MKIMGMFLAVMLLAGFAAVAKVPPKKGWIPLFNGKDLTGWKKNGDEKWVAEQRTILCESTVNKYGYLTTEKTYRDFNLRLKFKGEAAGNSGVFLHARITGTNPQHGPDIQGMQVEVDPNAGNTPAVFTKVPAAVGLLCLLPRVSRRSKPVTGMTWKCRCWAIIS